MVEVNFFQLLIARYTNFRRVQNHDKIARIAMRSIGRFMFAPQNTRNASAEAAEGLIGSINDYPIALGGFGICVKSCHHPTLLCKVLKFNKLTQQCQVWISLIFRLRIEILYYCNIISYDLDMAPFRSIHMPPFQEEWS